MIVKVLIALLAFVAGYFVQVLWPKDTYHQELLEGGSIDYEVLCKTEHWDILTARGVNGAGRGVSMGQEGLVRVTVLDDGPTLYVLTYRKGKKNWEGRLMDMGNDGTIDIVNGTDFGCERPSEN